MIYYTAYGKKSNYLATYFYINTKSYIMKFNFDPEKLKALKKQSLIMKITNEASIEAEILFLKQYQKTGIIKKPEDILVFALRNDLYNSFLYAFFISSASASSETPSTS